MLWTSAKLFDRFGEALFELIRDSVLVRIPRKCRSALKPCFPSGQSSTTQLGFWFTTDNSHRMLFPFGQLLVNFDLLNEWSLVTHLFLQYFESIQNGNRLISMVSRIFRYWRICVRPSYEREMRCWKEVCHSRSLHLLLHFGCGKSTLYPTHGGLVFLDLTPHMDIYTRATIVLLQNTSGKY